MASPLTLPDTQGNFPSIVTLLVILVIPRVFLLLLISRLVFPFSLHALLPRKQFSFHCVSWVFSLRLLFAVLFSQYLRSL